MRKLLLTTAAVSMLAATGASAQVLASVDAIVDTVTNTTAGLVANVGVVTSFANNQADIDGSIDISGLGAVGGSVTDSIITDATGTLTGLTFVNGGSATGASGTAPNIDVSSTIPALGVVCDVTAEGDTSSAADCNLGATSLTIADIITDTNTTVNNATTQMDFGAVSSAALGAVNSGAVTAVVNGAAAISSSAANSSSTASSAALDSVEAATVVATSAAYNDATTVDGSIGIDLDATSATFASIGTTAAGAINSGAISATINGIIGE